ncbi:hypothetical protein LUZ63_020328 [Rhynchospora breviuscula]|uniref:Imidazole acetol-phosphate transaminase n=1 Tax=Rhynchospora breviuscula TaxID=2022672 RepID=A0A9Q0C0Y6_9POAL|nr:hypothetical protein LUZ63_020328 [Rhynchospora breviuscula]
MTTYKLSSNENPFPPLPGVEEAAAAALARMNRYPDAGSTALYAALAARLGVSTEQLVAGTGSVAVLYHLVQAFCDPGDRVVHAWRSFEAYPIAIGVNAAVGVPVPLTADGRHDLTAMADAAAEPGTKVVVLCTPNNPTGPALTHAEVVGFLARVPRDVLVVVDEAYREFVRLDGAVDGVALLAEHPNVVVLRTFAKAYGLAGLRVGYAAAHRDVAAAVRVCALPFGVSAPAQAAAVAALEHEDELMARVEAIVAERERVVAALTGAGWELPETHGNFVWLPAGRRTSDLVTAADEAGIVLRPFAGDGPLSGVRATIGEPEANDRLVEVAARFAPASTGEPSGP